MTDHPSFDERLKHLPGNIDRWRAEAHRIRDETASAQAEAVPSEERLVAIETTAGELYDEIESFKQTVAEMATVSPAAAAELAPVSETLHLVLLEITELGIALYSRKSGLAASPADTAQD